MKTEAHPALALRSYAWALIKANTTLTEASYGGISPITPLSEEPDLADRDLPIIVYGYDEDITNNVSVTRDGSITFVVKDQNFRRLGQIINILLIGFGRWDDAAAAVNKYIMSLSPNYNINPFKGLRFTETHVTVAEGGTPEETEGGRQSGMISIAFCAVVDYDEHMKNPDGTLMFG